MKPNNNLKKSLFLAFFCLLGLCILQAQSLCDVCTGNGSNSYLLLDAGNDWVFTPYYESTIISGSGASPYQDYLAFSNGSGITNTLADSAGTLYLTLGLSQGIIPGNSAYIINSANQFMFLPANPYGGQEWSANVATCNNPYEYVIATCRILNIDTTIITPVCTYNNCLEMQIVYTVYDIYNTPQEYVTWTHYWGKGPGDFDQSVSTNGNVATNYYLSSARLNGCTTTGITEVSEQAPEIRIYPNPASSLVTIECPAINNETGNISLTDITGKETSVEINKESDKAVLNLSDLAPGVYIVSIVIDGSKTSKLVVRQ